LALLQDAQQLGLDFQEKLADFIASTASFRSELAEHTSTGTASPRSRSSRSRLTPSSSGMCQIKDHQINGGTPLDQDISSLQTVRGVDNLFEVVGKHPPDDFATHEIVIGDKQDSARFHG